MKTQTRYLFSQIKKDLQKKMVFIGGPRQVGKTTLAGQFIQKNEKQAYLNWDNADHRELILKRELPATKIWVFDEIHKYRGWRNYLKGLYDVKKTERKILVTGSARLDFYRRGGDSLQGRYHYLRLHPLSVSELKITEQKDFLKLLNLGGFPEPFWSGKKIEAKRWSRKYRERFIREDLVSLEQINDLGNLELLMLRLPNLVGSPLSINALREDLQLAHKTIANWLNIFERLYAIFRLSPYGNAKIRAVKKEQKHYHFDWSLISKESIRFENLVACHLLKWVHFLEDTEGRNMELRYFKDVDGREVDFIVLEDDMPQIAIECKWDDDEIGKGLRLFKKNFPACTAFQISAVGKKNYVSSQDITVCPAVIFLRDFI